MDSSTSTSFDPVRYALRGHRIQADELSVEDWLYILEDVIARLKPQLVYMDGFRHIERPTEVWEQHQWLKDASFQSPVPKRALWRPVAVRIQLVPFSPAPHLWASLVLNREGRWIDAGYMRHSDRPNPYWRYVDDALMKQFLGDTDVARPGWLGMTILENLAEMVRITAHRQALRLDETRSRQSWMQAVMNRLDSR